MSTQRKSFPLIAASLALACFVAAALLAPEPGLRADRTDALRSTTIYPPQAIRTRMSHQHPEHARLRCERCHEGASDSTRSSDTLLPRESSCAPCHDAQTNREEGGDCAYCHVGEPAGSEIPAPRLHFSHEAHSSAGAGCLECHDVRRADLATRQHLPTMRSCFRCHGRDGIGGRREGADSACRTCHLSEPDGALRTQFGDARMLPPRWLLSMDHDRDFLVRHRWVAADNGSVCVECHSENECVACHDGRIRPLGVHPNDFLTTHGPMARRDENRCASCHTVQRFCTECHSRLGLSPMASAIAAPAGNFHPAGWIDSGHAMEARRSMNTCTSCHAEQDCVTCHGASGVGGGVSPHPPEFFARCASLQQANDRACRTCHGDTPVRCP